MNSRRHWDTLGHSEVPMSSEMFARQSVVQPRVRGASPPQEQERECSPPSERRRSTISSEGRDQFVGDRQQPNGNVTLNVPNSNNALDVNLLLQNMTLMLQQNQEMMRMMANSGRFADDDVSPAKNFHVMPDLSKGIADFDGENPNEAKKWIETLVNTAEIHQWPPAFAFETARIHLTGAAKCWFEGRQTVIRTWSQFVYAFRQTFILEESITTTFIKMSQRVQGQRESLHTYYHDKVNMCLKLSLSFGEIKERVAVGLLNRELATMIMAKTHAGTTELYHDLIRFDNMIQERIMNSRDRREKPETKTEKNHKTTAKREQSDEKNKPKRRCYNCLAEDHIASECSKPKTMLCFKCHGEGHMAAQCPKEQKSTTENTRGKSDVRSKTDPRVKREVMVMDADIVESNNTSGGRFIKNVILAESLKLPCFVDMGSAVCTIRASAVLDNDLKCDRSNLNIYAFGSTEPVLTSKQFVTEKLSIDGVTVPNIKVHVVPDYAQPIDVLIGRSFTEHPDVAYSRIGEELKFGYRDSEPFKNLALNFNTKSHVRVGEGTVLEKNSINLVATSWEGVNVAVTNHTDEPVQLRKGESLFRITTDHDEIANIQQPIVKEMLNCDATLSDEQIDSLLALINKYRGCFALNERELGCTNLIEMNIEDNGVPVRAKPYRVSASERETIAKIVSDWKERGLVEPTTSEYASPVLLVPKKSGESRLVVDFRRLNAQTVKKNYPVPTVDEQLESLSGCSLFTSLDLAMGYMQVPLNETSRAKTAFITPDETGQFTRMIFGLCDAPYIFCQLMNIALGPLKNKAATYYLDDILVPAEDWDQMVNRLEQVLQALQKARLTLRLTKCEFGNRQLEYLGFRISEGCIQPGIQKTKSIKEFERPKTVTEVKRFLGLSSFFRRFVPNYAKLAKPLSDLTRRGAPMVFGPEQESAFETLKTKLCSEPVLMLYNPKARTELHTDASSEGLAGMLLQEGTDGKLHLVYCVSKKTSDAESRYPATKLKLMAVVWSINRLRNFVFGLKFTVVTDCKALTYLQVKKTMDSQIARWYNTLSDFDFDVKYREGARMAHVDALSRAPVENANENEDVYERVSVFTIIDEADQVLMIQRSDARLSNLINILQKKKEDRSNDETRLIEGYKLEDGRLLRIVRENGRDKRLYVIPTSMRKGIVVKHHDMEGHFGLDRTVAAIRKRYWFPAMKSYVRQHIRGCFRCLIQKIPAGKGAGELHPIPVPMRPFERIHVDHIGPFPITPKGNAHIIVLIDALTKFTKLFPVKSTKVDPVIRALSKVFNDFGLPKRIVTDRGSCFTSGKFEEFCEQRGIKHTLNSSRHPQANGQVERVNRTLIATMATSTEAENNWDRVTGKVERDLNNAESKTTRKTPFECLYGYCPEFHDQTMHNISNIDGYELPEVVREEVKENIRREQTQMKTRYDKRRFKGVKFDVGDIVVMRCAPKATQESQKLQPKYQGPLVITQCLPADTYRVSRIPEATPGRVYATTAHVSQLKIYKNPTEGDEDEMEDCEDTSTETETSNKDLNASSEVRKDPKTDKIASGREQVRRVSRARKPPNRLDDYVLS